MKHLYLQKCISSNNNTILTFCKNVWCCTTNPKVFHRSMYSQWPFPLGMCLVHCSVVTPLVLSLPNSNVSIPPKHRNSFQIVYRTFFMNFSNFFNEKQVNNELEAQGTLMQYQSKTLLYYYTVRPSAGGVIISWRENN